MDHFSCAFHANWLIFLALDILKKKQLQGGGPEKVRQMDLPPLTRNKNEKNDKLFVHAKAIKNDLGGYPQSEPPLPVSQEEDSVTA